MQSVGTPMIANGVHTGGLITRSTSNRKKKYHSGLGTYVVVVGSDLGPSSAPKYSDRKTIIPITIAAIHASLATMYGKNGLPSFFSAEDSLSYASLSPAFPAT